MKIYNSKITLIKNSRGVYDLDTSKGCYSGMVNKKKGCYDECYAARFSNQYGYNFNTTVKREFENIKHLEGIRNRLFNIDMPFVRVGNSGDPSENWNHFMSIVNLIHGCKPIVAITKHWEELTISQLKELEKYDICINTSISALDDTNLIKHRLKQYNIIKSHCKSVLRVVSCDFNKKNLTGLLLNDMQLELLNNHNVIDNVLRLSKNNKLVKLGVVNIQKQNFLSADSYFSKSNKSTYTGNCNTCPDMCGINTNN